MKNVKIAESKVQAMIYSVAYLIESSFDELYKNLKDRKQELLEETRKMVTQEIETSLSTLNSVWSTPLVTSSCASSPKSRVVSTKWSKSNVSPVLNLDPVEDADIGVVMSSLEKLKQLMAKARIIQCPIDATVKGDGIRFAEVDKKSEFQVTTKLFNGQPVRRKCNVKCIMILPEIVVQLIVSWVMSIISSTLPSHEGGISFQLV